MPKVNGHRYNIVCNSVQEREEITDETLFAIYYAKDDEQYDFSYRCNRVFQPPMTLSILIKFLETVPSERKYRLRLRPRKTRERRLRSRQTELKRMQAIQAIQAKLARLKEVREKC